MCVYMVLTQSSSLGAPSVDWRTYPVIINNLTKSVTITTLWRYHIYVFLYKYVFTCVCVCVCVNNLTKSVTITTLWRYHIYVFLYKYVFTCVCVCVCVCVRVSEHLCLWVFLYMRTYALPMYVIVYACLHPVAPTHQGIVRFIEVDVWFCLLISF